MLSANCSYTSALNNITPYELWTGFKLDVSHFKFFGYIAYFHILDEKRTKLDIKT
jgi:hypothetical protein